MKNSCSGIFVFVGGDDDTIVGLGRCFCGDDNDNSDDDDLKFDLLAFDFFLLEFRLALFL